MVCIGRPARISHIGRPAQASHKQSDPEINAANNIPSQEKAQSVRFPELFSSEIISGVVVFKMSMVVFVEMDAKYFPSEEKTTFLTLSGVQNG